MSYQTRSSLPKKGEGDIHFDSKILIKRILHKLGWSIVTTEEVLPVNWRFFKPDIKHYGHAYDVYAEFHHDNKLVTRVIIEVDGKEHYEDENQIRADKKAEAFITFFEPDIHLIRIKKDFVYKNKDNDQKIIDELNKKINEKYSISIQFF